MGGPSLVQLWGPRYNVFVVAGCDLAVFSLGTLPDDAKGLLAGEIAGTWRRADTVMTVQPWRRLSPAEREAVTAETESLPLPGIGGRRIVVRWDE